MRVREGRNNSLHQKRERECVWVVLASGVGWGGVGPQTAEGGEGRKRAKLWVKERPRGEEEEEGRKGTNTRGGKKRGKDFFVCLALFFFFFGYLPPFLSADFGLVPTKSSSASSAAAAAAG